MSDNKSITLRCGCDNADVYLIYDLSSERENDGLFKLLTAVSCESCGASWQLGEICAREESDNMWPDLPILPITECNRCGFIQCSCMGGRRA